MLSRALGAASAARCAPRAVPLAFAGAPRVVAVAPPALLVRLPTAGAAAALRRRLMSTQPGQAPPAGGAAGAAKSAESTIALLRKYAPQIWLGAGALVVIYGVSSIGLSVASGIMSLDIWTVFKYGVATGAGAALALGGGALYGLRLRRISPEAAFRKALARVQSSQRAQEALGTNIRSGQLKAYVAHRGHFALGGKAQPLAWVEPRVQLLFQVAGEVNEGMVTAEAVKHKGGVVLSLVALDTLAKPSAPARVLLLKGSEDRLHVRGTLRGFLQTERAAYIPQDAAEMDDDARVREQSSLPTEEEDDAAAAAAAVASGLPIDKYPTPGRA
jgi:hypothetical protein